MQNRAEWIAHPWVTEASRRVRFSLVHPLIGGEPDWSSLQENVHLAESLGFDAYWFSDHPLLNPDCWVRIAGLAATTRTIRLGTIVTCIYYRHPVLLARMVADIDRMSGGRVVLGLGVGDFAPEFQQLGIEFPPIAERQQALAEYIQIMCGVWGDRPFSLPGKHFTVQEARVQPPPLQWPHVPILIAGAGERTTLRQVAEFADASNFGPNPHTGSVFGADAVRQKIGVLRDHCARLGRPFESILRTYWSPPVVLASTNSELQRKREAILPDEHRFYGDHMIVGTPAGVIPRFQELIDAGAQYFILHTRADPETAQLLAEQVIPALQVSPAPRPIRA